LQGRDAESKEQHMKLKTILIVGGVASAVASVTILWGVWTFIFWAVA
jgi:hypothetical protein